MIKPVILFFGSKIGFDIWREENAINGFELKLCTTFDRVRGEHFIGWITHGSASPKLMSEVFEARDHLQYVANQTKQK